MWQVVTSPPQLEMFAEQERRLFGSEIDDLLDVLAAWQPVLPPARSTNLLPFKAKSTSLRRQGPAASDVRAGDVISVLEVPRPVNAPLAPSWSPALCEPLLKLRSTVLLAAEVQGLRTVLLCGAEPLAEEDVAAHLSQSLADFDRLKIAFVDVRGEPADPQVRRKVLPIGYTFQIRRTRRANLYEIASSLGAVRLDDWLRWWSPKVVLQEMQKLFDLVVIQAPPITTHPDVALLATAVDGVILVATENVTAYANVEAATRALRAANARILGVTMNQAPAASSPLANIKSRVRELIEAIAKNR